MILGANPAGSAGWLGVSGRDLQAGAEASHMGGGQRNDAALPEPPCDETLLALPSLELESELLLLLVLLSGPFPLGDSAGQQPSCA